MIISLFFYGLIIGSFLNVLIYRLNTPGAPKFWQGRSFCPGCKHRLSWLDNIPLLSFLFLRGKCRYCHKKISFIYPLVEFLTGIIFLYVGFQPLLLTLTCVFIVLFFSDLIYGFIPDQLIVAGLILSVLSGKYFLLVGLAAVLPFFILARFKKMGYGDVTLVFLMGFLLGFPNIIIALWAGFIIGGLSAVILLVLRKTKLSATIPLGPFLIIGLVISALWSNQILRFLGVTL